MKKVLLSLFCLAGAATLAYADITEDFNTAFSSTVAAGTTDPVKSEKTELAWTFSGSAKTTSYNGSYYVFLPYSTNGAISTTIDFVVSEIQITTTSNCSEKDSNTISVLIGENTLVSKYAVNARSTTYKISIDADSRVENGTYTFQADGSKNSQIAAITFVEATSNPSLSVATETLQFGAPLNVAVTKNISLTAENVEGEISFVTSGDVFTGTGSLALSDIANGFDITMQSATAGTFTGETVITVGDLSETIALSAVVAEHAGSEADPLTVADVLALNNLYSGKEVYVTGTICDKTAANGSNGVIGEASTNVKTNILIQDADGNKIPVALPTDSDDNKNVQSTLNIVDNTDNIGKTVIVKGLLQSYYSVPGVKNTVYVYLSEDDSSAITDITSDVESATAVYYNLRGERVAQPGQGVYIRVINNKAVKVIF